MKKHKKTYSLVLITSIFLIFFFSFISKNKLYTTNNLQSPVEWVPNKATKLQPTMEKFIGINSFIDVPLEIDKAAGFIREYHNWNWNEGKDPIQLKFNPSQPGWDFDKYYSDRKQNDIMVAPCIQGSSTWLGQDFDHKPIKNGANPTDPHSYAVHAAFLFQYAARYGNKTIEEQHIKSSDQHKKISGTNLLQYYEDWNEQDKWWAGDASKFTPEEYAAMASADYDGHLNSMGEKYGIKNADPNAKLVMGGLVGLNIGYIKAMKAWVDEHRKGSFPADVLNFHHYSHNENKKNPSGISPEEDKLKEKLLPLVAYRNQHFPDKEIWLTEFGYDIHPKSPQRAPAIGPYTAEEVQGQWLIRSYLEIAAAGIDRAVMYMVRDVNSKGAGKYSTSGLVSDKTSGMKPRTSWYYVYTFKNILTGFRFHSEVSSGNEKVKVYKFRHISKNKEVYAVWCPSSDGTTVNDFRLPLGNNQTEANLTILVHNDTKGHTSTLEVTYGKVKLSVSERPLFVTATSMANVED